MKTTKWIPFNKQNKFQYLTKIHDQKYITSSYLLLTVSDQNCDHMLTVVTSGTNELAV